MENQWFECEIEETPDNSARKIYNSAHGIIGEQKERFIEKLIQNTDEKVIWRILCPQEIVSKIEKYYSEIQFKIIHIKEN